MKKNCVKQYLGGNWKIKLQQRGKGRKRKDERGDNS